MDRKQIFIVIHDKITEHYEEGKNGVIDIVDASTKSGVPVAFIEFNTGLVKKYRGFPFWIDGMMLVKSTH